MKNHLNFFVTFLAFTNFAVAQSKFVDDILFKGIIVDNRFKGVDFEIIQLSGAFTISQNDITKKSFVIKREEDSVQDIVFSHNRAAIAVAMRATNVNNRKMAIVTVNTDGKQRVFDYKPQLMTDRLGWLVELGGVSNDGSHILAKCAYMLPKNEDGILHVRHEWTILLIGNQSIKTIVSADAINKWHQFANL